MLTSISFRFPYTLVMPYAQCFYYDLDVLIVIKWFHLYYSYCSGEGSYTHCGLRTIFLPWLRLSCCYWLALFPLMLLCFGCALGIMHLCIIFLLNLWLFVRIRPHNLRSQTSPILCSFTLTLYITSREPLSMPLNIWILSCCTCSFSPFIMCKGICFQRIL